MPSERAGSGGLWGRVAVSGGCIGRDFSAGGVAWATVGSAIQLSSRGASCVMHAFCQLHRMASTDVIVSVEFRICVTADNFIIKSFLHLRVCFFDHLITQGWHGFGADNETCF